MSNKQDLQQLPIEEIRSKFDAQLSQSPLVVEAPPGSGKSTRLPVWCAEKGRVLVVEPRRMACRSLARFTAQSLGQEIGQEVGYAVRFANYSSQDSRIVFATPGVALRWYARDAFAGFSTVILDEFHERRWDTDLLAALLKDSPKQLVLASATVQGGKLADYLQGQRLQSQGRMYEVQVRYQEKDALPRTRHLDKRAADAVFQALEESGGGDILVFLPGKGEIRDVEARLKKRGPKAEVIPLHASVDEACQDRALQPGKAPRVILATNVAETSLTLPGVSFVVDSGLERRTLYRNGRTVLALCAISQAAAEQRAGRAGRLGPGKCVRLWGRAARLEAYTPPEVVREDPTELVLAAAASGKRLQDLSCPDPVPEHAAQKATARLQALGALDGQGHITRHGLSLFSLPLDAQLAHLIAAASSTDSRSDLVDLAAALSAQANILLPPRSEKAVQELQEIAPEPCDACTLIRVLRQDPPESIPVNRQALQEARRISRQIRQSLELPQGLESRPPHRQQMLRDILQADPELAFVRRIKRNWSLGNGNEEVQIGAASRMPGNQEAALVLDRHSVPGKGTTQTVSIATCLAPLSLQELARAGVGEVRKGQPQLQESQVQVLAQRIYAGRVIESWSETTEGRDLRQAVTELVAQGELWPETGGRLQDDVQAWNLYCRLGFAQGKEVDFRAWLEERLAEIGLEDSQDLQALEPEDLDFQGMPQWERKELDEKYPRRIVLPNLKLDVCYEPLKKRITLTRSSGIRKTAPKRWELPSWDRNWEIRYKDGSRVVP
ncbi:MAG: helicase-related protein, partial [Desulfohalobiaceae bacterium]